MLDHVLLSPDDMDQVPENVEQRFMGFLDSVNAEARHGETILANFRHSAAITAGKAHRQHAEVAGHLQRPIDVRRLAARGNSKRDVAAPSEQTKLFEKGNRKVLIISDSG